MIKLAFLTSLQNNQSTGLSDFVLFGYKTNRLSIN